MAGTTISDIIVPELFNPYVVQKTMENLHFSIPVLLLEARHSMPWQAKQHVLTTCHSSKICRETLTTS